MICRQHVKICWQRISNDLSLRHHFRPCRRHVGQHVADNWQHVGMSEFSTLFPTYQTATFPAKNINAVRKSIMPADPNKNICFKDVDKYSRKYYNISLQRVTGNFLNAIGGIAIALLQRKQGNFVVQLHITENGNDKDRDIHCVVYDGISVRNKF